MGIEKRLIEDANLTRGMQLATPERITKVIRDVLKGEVGVRVKVYEQTCMRCGACAKACPNHLIEVFDASRPVEVICSSHFNAKETIKMCKNGCIGCRKCKQTGKCVFDDIVNETAQKFEAADGIVIGSPVYFASANSTAISFITRLFYSTQFDKSMKVGAAVVEPFATSAYTPPHLAPST